jgi:hypothetical protein
MVGAAGDASGNKAKVDPDPRPEQRKHTHLEMEEMRRRDVQKRCGEPDMWKSRKEMCERQLKGSGWAA